MENACVPCLSNSCGITSKWRPFGHLDLSYPYLHPDCLAISEKVLYVFSISHIQVKFLRCQQCLSVTGYAISIFLAAQSYIAEVLGSTGTNFRRKILLSNFQLSQCKKVCSASSVDDSL